MGGSTDALKHNDGECGGVTCACLKTEKTDNKISVTKETFHGKMAVSARDLTAKVSEKGKTKTCKAEDSILGSAETPAYSVLGALLDKITDVSHVPIDREASTLFNRRATDD